jgi:hypothetical protein
MQTRREAVCRKSQTVALRSPRASPIRTRIPKLTVRTKVLRARHAKLSGFAFSKLPVCSSSLHQSKPPRSVGIEGHHPLDLSAAPNLPSSRTNRRRRRSPKGNTMHLPNQRSKKIASRTLTTCISAPCGSRSRRRSQLPRPRLRKINHTRSLSLRKRPRSCPPPR